jgi:hypothetical protein
MDGYGNLRQRRNRPLGAGANLFIYGLGLLKANFADSIRNITSFTELSTIVA